MTYIDGATAARFWAKVQRGDGCWQWTGARIPGGYGSLSVHGRQQGAHRVSWALTNGTWPEGMVLHRCGDAGCVRPDHLYIGTGSQNCEDARTHGTLPLGESHGNAKLTDDDVAAIRRRYAAGGETQSALAEAYGCSQAQISNIVRGYQRGSVSVVAQRGARPRPMLTCEQCGTRFERSPGQRAARFCSRACRSAAQRKAGPRTCPVCQTVFHRPPSAKGETCSYKCMGILRSRRLTT